MLLSPKYYNPVESNRSQCFQSITIQLTILLKSYGKDYFRFQVSVILYFISYNNHAHYDSVLFNCFKIHCYY